MYQKFFGFSTPPFKLIPDPRFFFYSKNHDEAISHIQYGLKERKGFIVIVGEIGTGKTTLCRLLMGRLDWSIKTALLFNPQLSGIELLQSINQDFGLWGKSPSKKLLIDELNGFLLGLLSQGKSALLIVDEAQLLSIGCLEEIRLLSNLETEQEKLIQILLIGQPELKEKLESRSLRQLKQRISLIHEIGPLGKEEVGLYLASRIRAAGGADTVAFSPKAVGRIRHFSKGFPRLINVAADQALLAAYVANATYVTGSLAARAIEELEKGSQKPSLSSLYRWELSSRKGKVGAPLFLIITALLFAAAWYWKDRLVIGIDLLKTFLPGKAD
ncbi:MAG: ExeA family protein [Nitrospiria bacterium]